MDAMDAILTRRSVRRFKNEPISQDAIQKILEAGMYAPSAGDERPWHFIVVTDREKLKAIPSASPYAMMAKDAAAAIVVCGDLHLQKYQGFWVQDCSAAVENMLLACHALGLGAVWTGAYPMVDRMEGIQKLFGIPEHVIPLAIIPLGVPNEKAEKAERYQQERVHHETW